MSDIENGVVHDAKVVDIVATGRRACKRAAAFWRHRLKVADISPVYRQSGDEISQSPGMQPINPEAILNAYVQGAFPMADARGTIRWYTADPRGIIPLQTFRAPRSVRQLIQRNAFEIRFDFDFRAVMIECSRNRAGGTWINKRLIDLYTELHHMGFAHSVEAWQDGKLVGGLYGVALGSAFFGESMFHRVSNASKVALVHLVDRLRQRDFTLLDTQAATKHLQSLGCIEVSARDYKRMLRDALTNERSFG